MKGFSSRLLWCYVLQEEDSVVVYPLSAENLYCGKSKNISICSVQFKQVKSCFCLGTIRSLNLSEAEQSIAVQTNLKFILRQIQGLHCIYINNFDVD